MTEGHTFVDCHNDFLLLFARERALGHSDSLRRRFVPQFREAGIDVQVAPIYIEAELLPEGALRHTLRVIEQLTEEVEATSDVVALCLSGEEIERAVALNKLALVLALEGSHAIGSDVELFSTVYRLGVRMASFTWMGNTPLAGGSADGDPGAGLSRKGVEALGVLESLGIVMDVSHLSLRSTADVLERATRPVVASHSSARALKDHHRNLLDEHMKGIAASGGVIGITAIPSFTDLDKPILDRVIDHIVHVAETVRIDHVGIGADFIREYVDEVYATYPDVTMEGVDLRDTIEGLASPADIRNLAPALERRSFSATEVAKVLGGNFLRVFGEVMGKPQPSQERQAS
ncbi:MAG: dipeptidase [Actinomycetota bacterium]